MRAAFVPFRLLFNSSRTPLVRICSTFPSDFAHPSNFSTMPELKSWKVERGEAVRAVAIANALARRLQHSFRATHALSKSDSSPVTVADFAVQALIVSRLHAAFPKDRFIAEETSVALRENPALLNDVVTAVNDACRDAGTAPLTEEQVLSNIDLCDYKGADGARTWILDPIDGTKGFVSMRQYCVALALTYQGVVQLGVLGCPNLPHISMHVRSDSQLGCVFHAVKGTGAYMLTEAQIGSEAVPAPLGKRVHVSDVADPVWSLFCESVETGHSSHELSARIAAELGVKEPPVRMDSQAKYGCLARGDASVFMRFPRAGYVENVWDHAAGVVVIEEAGGRVTDGRGRPLDFSLGRTLDNDDGIVATNGRIHNQVVEAIGKAIAASSVKLT